VHTGWHFSWQSCNSNAANLHDAHEHEHEHDAHSHDAMRGEVIYEIVLQLQGNPGESRTESSCHQEWYESTFSPALLAVGG
jgi:hypothetical protein